MFGNALKIIGSNLVCIQPPLTTSGIGGQEELDAKELIKEFTSRTKIPKNILVTTAVRARLRTFAHYVSAWKGNIWKDQTEIFLYGARAFFKRCIYLSILLNTFV
jgi:hypothetical protein